MLSQRSGPWSVWLLLGTLLFAAPRSGFAQTQPSGSFEERAHQAELLLDTKPAESAILYKQLLGERPSWAEGWFYLGAASYRLERYQEARDAFEKNIPLNPTNGTAWAFLGLCEFELNHFDRALSNIEKGEKLGLGGNPQFETAVRQRAALALIRASLFDQALSQLQPLNRLHVDSPAVTVAAGLCALAEGHLPSELSASRRAVVNLAGKAQWAATSQRPAEAEAAYRELLATYPHERGVHYAHGLYLLESDQSAALEEFRTELKADPQHWPSLMASAFLETSRGDPDAAIAAIRKAEQVIPAGYRWLCNAEMGRAYLNLNQTEKAIAFFEASAKLEPINAQIHYYLEQAYRRAGRRADAEKQKAEFARLKAEQDPLALPDAATGGGKP